MAAAAWPLRYGPVSRHGADTDFAIISRRCCWGAHYAEVALTPPLHHVSSWLAYRLLFHMSISASPRCHYYRQKVMPIRDIRITLALAYAYFILPLPLYFTPGRHVDFISEARHMSSLSRYAAGRPHGETVIRR